MKKLTKEQQRNRRRIRSRVRMHGTESRPRLVIHRSLRGFSAQLINDDARKTVVSIHSKTAGVSGDAGDRTGRVALSFLLGKALAEKAKAAGVTSAVFDRAGYKYHGRIQAFADGAREGGLQF